MKSPTMTMSLMMALIVSNSAAGQAIPQSSYQQIVFVLHRSESIELSLPLMQATLTSLPLKEIASRSLGDDEQVLSLAVQLALTGEFGRPGDAFYLSIVFKGEVSEESKRKIWADVAHEFSEQLSKAVARVEEHALATRNKQIERLKALIDRVERTVDENARFIHDLEKDQSPLTPDQLREQVQQLSERIRELELDRIAWEARREATVEQIERMRAKAERASNEDPVLQELERLVDLKEQQFAIIVKNLESGLAKQDVVTEAEANVAEARIRLLEQRQKQFDPGLASQISTLNVRLAEGVIEMVEARKMESELKDRLSLARTLLSEKVHGSTANEIAQIRLDVGKRRLAEAIRELSELESLSNEPAEVKVVPWVE